MVKINPVNTVTSTVQVKSTDDIKAQIKDLETKLKYQMEHPPQNRDLTDWGYYEIGMNRLQAQIKELREKVPVDRTNLEEVMMARPLDYFRPNDADNVKGKGISILPVVPVDDPDELKKVTYNAVPIFTNARTMEEMIRIGKRDGLKNLLLLCNIANCLQMTSG